MNFDIDALLNLWSEPHAPGPEAEAAFGRFYTDPVLVNGSTVRLSDLVDRAIALQLAFEHLEREVLDVSRTNDAVTIVFRLSGRHVGPLACCRNRLPDRPNRQPAHYGSPATDRGQGRHGVDDRRRARVAGSRGCGVLDSC